jgi:hypothetical protein
MKIQIKKLTLLNFQGIRNLEVEFSPVTTIWGDNATGKTTIFNAFTWLMFGKDSQDRQQFEIKTLDKNNRVISKINHEVAGIIAINGVEKEFKRVLREKWTKKRGESQAEFAGNTEDYFIDRVPLKKNEYQDEITKIIREDQFKLITNPLYFNDRMDWRTRRNMLFRMAGEISYAETAEQHPELKNILPEIEKKSIEGLKKQLAVDKKAIREQLDQITPRIDEQSRTMPQMPDVEKITIRMAELNNDYKAVNGNLEAIKNANKAKVARVQTGYSEINQLSRQIEHIKSDAQQKANELNAKETAKITQRRLKREVKEDEIKSLENKIKNAQKEIEYLNEQNNVLRDKINALNNDNPDFSKILTHCPTCKRPFDESDIESKREDIEKAFNEDKVKKYSRLQDQGLTNKEQIEQYNQNIEKWTEDVLNFTVELSEPEETIETKTYSAGEFEDTKKIAELQEKIKAIREEIEKPEPMPDDEAELTRAAEIEIEIDKLKEQLSTVKVIEGKKDRIKELEDQAKDLAQQLADLEKQEYLVELFNKTYINSIEDKISSLFGNSVRFRMFKEQINGGETEDCTLIVNGVPWTDLNSAGKIQAGITCINTISKHFGYSAPIFCDNAESVVSLPETESQLIRLVVSENHKELTINS